MGGLDLYEQLMERFGATGADLTVTLYQMSLGSVPDSQTGQYPVTFDGGTSVTMMLFTKGAQAYLTGLGLFIKKDALGISKTVSKEGDEVLDKFSQRWRIVTVQIHSGGGTLLFYEVQLTRKQETD